MLSAHKAVPLTPTFVLLPILSSSYVLLPRVGGPTGNSCGLLIMLELYLKSLVGAD